MIRKSCIRCLLTHRPDRLMTSLSRSCDNGAQDGHCSDKWLCLWPFILYWSHGKDDGAKKGRKNVWSEDIVFTGLATAMRVKKILLVALPFLLDKHSKRPLGAPWSQSSLGLSFPPFSLASECRDYSVLTNPPKTVVSHILCLGSAWESYEGSNQELNIQPEFLHL